MQTFLPYKSFILTAACLDNQRLGKQRVEVLQILNTLLGKTKGWANHPAVRMWKGYESTLCAYGLEICEQWKYERKFKDTCYDKIYDIERSLDNVKTNRPFYPPWLTDEFCLSQRSNLLRKDPVYYRQFWPDTPDNLPYIWPM